MRLNTSGQLLINTTSAPAAYKLAVNGSVRTKEVVVESGWSDYVLLHLIEMKKEIKQLKEENEQQKKEVNK